MQINIWEYADERYAHLPFVKQYQKWCVVTTKEKWSLHFIDFDFVTDNLKKQNKKWFDVSKLSSTSRDRIYSAICEVSARSKKDN